ncbi:MAG TPA: EamA family transporter [Gemmatimonadota bacterium]|nr:EamA family transporter [Gemmatimonadota bacterium]
MNRRVVAGHAALATVQVFFGLFPIFGTLAFTDGGFSPLGLVSWRIAAGALALGGLAFATYGRAAIPRREDWPRLIACGLLGAALNQSLFLAGLDRTTPMNAGLMMSLIPVFTFTVATAVRQERFNPVRALGVAVALSGAVLLLVGRGGGFARGYGFGNLLIALNGFSYACYLVIAKRLVSRYPPLVVIGWVYILALPYLIYFVPGETLVAERSNVAAWTSLAYILLFPTILAYLLNMFALERVRATTTAVYIYAQPLVAGLASWIIFGERLTTGMAIAAACLFVGIWLVARRPPA